MLGAPRRGLLAGWRVREATGRTKPAHKGSEHGLGDAAVGSIRPSAKEGNDGSAFSEILLAYAALGPITGPLVAGA